MRRVYKWPLAVTSSLSWSPDDRVLLVAHQDDDLPTLWAEQDDSNPRARLFVVVGTGQPAPGGMEHVGSAVCRALVWHVYAEPVERSF